MSPIEASLRDCKNGQLEPFSDIYNHFIDKIYLFIFHKTMDDITTEDIVSDVFFKALKHIESFS